MIAQSDAALRHGGMPTIWPKLRPHLLQSKLWRCTKRFVQVAAGRGSGKTEVARRYVIRQLPLRKPWSDPLYFYALPTFKQAKRIAWEPLKRLIPKHWIKNVNESELFIDTVYGSRLYLLGMDKPARAEGVQWDGGVVDEACDQKPGLFDRTLLPAFTHRTAWCWRIGVPKRFGIGASEFKEAFDKGMEGTNDNMASFTWDSATVLSPEDLQFMRESLDPRDFNEQFCARWETASGAIFYSFDPLLNVADANDPRMQLKPDQKLFIGCDFNVDPMCWIIGQMSEDKRKFYVFDEIVMRNSNTKEALDLCFKRYGHHKAGVVFFGDASSRNRHTSTVTTDYVQIFNDKRWIAPEVNFPHSNPAVLDRFATCNAMLCNAAGERRCVISKKCKRLRADCTSRAFKPGTREADDSGDMGHASDAWGYVMMRLFPLRAIATNSPGVHY